MSSYEQRAAKIGRNAGVAAASWVFDGNTTQETYKSFLAAIEGGDPLILDSVRTPDLSGEFAGDYTPGRLLHDVNAMGKVSEERKSTIAEAWENAAGDAFWAEIERACRAQLS